jgi:predicted DNA-binding protein (MmcQ/YjbR family)
LSQQKGVTEGFPFDETTLVFKVGGKMFLLMALEKQPLVFSAKILQIITKNSESNITKFLELIT